MDLLNWTVTLPIGQMLVYLGAVVLMYLIFGAVDWLRKRRKRGPQGYHPDEQAHELLSRHVASRLDQDRLT